MSAIAVCDGCGKQEPMFHSGQSWHKPPQWFQRSDKDGVQLACSRDCIDTVAAKSGKTRAVLPI